MSARASVDLPLPDRPVKKSTSPWSSGAGWSRSTIAAISSGRSPPVDQAVDRVAGGVRRHHLRAQRVVVVGVAVRGQRDDDDVGALDRGGRHERGPDQGHGGELRGAGAGEREQDERVRGRAGPPAGCR